MSWLATALRRLAGLFRRGSMERRLDEEMRFHLEMLTERHVRLGMTPGEARRIALAEFGGVERFKDDARDEYRSAGLEGLMRDLRFALRSLRRAPAFALTAILTLALGIGANTAVFSVLNAVLLRELPYTDADRLARIYGRATDGTAERGPLSAGDYDDLAARQTTFLQLAPFRNHAPERALTGQGDPQSLAGGEVGATLFSVLGTTAQLGRTFAPGDDEPGVPPVVLLGNDVWRRIFRADPAVVGRRIMLDDTARTVVGVLPPEAGVPELEADLWLPLRLDPALRDPIQVRRRGWLGAIGRLRPDVTLEQAQGEVARIGRALEAEHPEVNTGRGLAAVSLREALAGETRPAVLTLFVASGLVLLIACANLAGAFLARLIARSRELAIRLALGAGRGRIARQLLTETVLLSVAGGVLGLMLASAGMDALRAAAPANGMVADTPLDRTVLAFAAAVSLGAALLFGVGPALVMARAELRGTLQASERGSGGGGRRGVRNLLLVIQFALAVALSACAGLMVKSLAELYDVALGFEPSRVLTFAVDPSGQRYADLEDHVRLLDAISSRLRGLSAVTGVAMASTLPLTSHDLAGAVAEGRPSPHGGIEFVGIAEVSDDYFRALRIPLYRGRTFGPEDGLDAPPVVIVSQRMADRFWPGQDPIGNRLRLGPDPDAPWKEVVGVVGDVRQDGVAEEPPPLAYVAARQNAFSPITVIVRTMGDPLALERVSRQALAAVDPLLPIFDVQPLEAVVDDDLANRRFLGLLLTIFAALALVLAAVGVHGVSAHDVSARRRELAVRIALGSTRRGVLALVLRRGVVLALVGFGLGVAGVGALTPLLRSFLFGISAVDFALAGLASLALLGVTLLGSLAPAHRASRAEPMLVLREE